MLIDVGTERLVLRRLFGMFVCWSEEGVGVKKLVDSSDGRRYLCFSRDSGWSLEETENCLNPRETMHSRPMMPRNDPIAAYRLIIT